MTYVALSAEKLIPAWDLDAEPEQMTFGPFETREVAQAWVDGWHQPSLYRVALLLPS